PEGRRGAPRREVTPVTARGFKKEALPVLFGLACLAAFFVVIELLILGGKINRFIVPLPSEVAKSFARIAVEENLFSRFLLTAYEALMATLLLSVAGISLGVLLHRFRLIRLATETWVAAFASAPLVLMYPLFLVMFGRSAWTIITIA